ncbi:hypothetical protein V6Z12_D09G083900 [Gossypium hirsutum]
MLFCRVVILEEEMELVGKAYMMGSFQIPAQDLTMRRLRGYEIKVDSTVIFLNIYNDT